MSRENFEPFVQLRRERATLRRKRRGAFAGGPGWERKHETHWQYRLNGDVLDYWPGPMKWRWRGKINTGDVFAFIRKREVAK